VSSYNIYDRLQAIIGTDAGGRGMRHLIVPHDLQLAATHITDLPPGSHVIILSGFPCCVTHDPPTETDGPPGTFAIARACAALDYDVTVVAEDVHEHVFQAAAASTAANERIQCRFFPTVSRTDDDREALRALARTCHVLVSCERAGQAQDGRYYTMKGVDMNRRRPLVSPSLNELVDMVRPARSIGIGDGGNELGMGKVLPRIRRHIPNGDTIGCVVPADHLIAASVSNWGGYALAAAMAVAAWEKKRPDDRLEHLLQRCLPTAREETELLHRCVAAGCRDGVSGNMEATVDGMPLETSMRCLEDIRNAVLDHADTLK
jgi:hypothetical protein